MSPAALPDDIETLKRLVIGRDEMIAKLMAEIVRVKRWRFGRSAERMDAALAQLQLLLGDLPAAAAGDVSAAAVLPVEGSTQSPPLQQRVTRLRRVPRTVTAVRRTGNKESTGAREGTSTARRSRSGWAAHRGCSNRW